MAEWRRLWRTLDTWIAALALAAILSHALLSVAGMPPAWRLAPLVLAIVIGGLPLLSGLIKQAIRRQFGSDVLAGLSIVTAVFLGEYLIAVVVILMLSGGQALEHYATARASSVLEALARRNPSVAHRQTNHAVVDVPLADVRVGDVLAVLPHETCPVDGVVRAGSSTMDESYLSGEPFLLQKTVGSAVMSGAINGEGLLTIEAERRAVDSRYARIMAIVAAAETRRPPMRRLADRLGAWYTPAAVTLAVAAWGLSGDSERFLAVLVIATPCPLLLAIPIAIISAISVAARRSILIRDAAVLERIGSCRTVIFDKTGTLTLGRPALADVVCQDGFRERDVLALAASLEQYSRHPLAQAVLAAADREGLSRLPVTDVSERPGQGLSGHVANRTVRITSRRHARSALAASAGLPVEAEGLECVVVADGRVAALLRFRDEPRRESASLVRHLGPRHQVNRLLIVSGDRESEVRYVAARMEIAEVSFGQSPEQKVAIVERERRQQPTLFVGDGINDAAAMATATVGIALGQQGDIAGESAGAVVLDGSLARVDELLHIARRTRAVALQSAVGGISLSLLGMAFAALGWLPAMAGAVAQEAIDVAAVLNALRAAWPPPQLTDFEGPGARPDSPIGADRVPPPATRHDARRAEARV